MTKPAKEGRGDETSLVKFRSTNKGHDAGFTGSYSCHVSRGRGARKSILKNISPVVCLVSASRAGLERGRERKGSGIWVVCGFGWLLGNADRLPFGGWLDIVGTCRRDDDIKL